MLSILKKEIHSFFASAIGYLVVGIFLLTTSLVLFLFKSDYNVLDYGFADLNAFFALAPWVLLFLIPAVTMRSFSEEQKQGTLELLLTKPLTHLQLILGKFFGAFTLILMALLPTLIYVAAIYQLGNPIGNIDFGSLIGSYFGLVFLIATYTAIGIFSSLLTSNQIVAFLIAVLLCLFFYIGFQGIADFFSSTFIEQLGLNYHYKSISRGVIDTRNLIYFLSVTAIFITLALLKLKNTKQYRLVLIISVMLVVANVISVYVYKRFDLTDDKRYTLSQTTNAILNDATLPIIIDVFLEGDNFPSEIRRLQQETKQLLDEFSTQNHLVKYNFINPTQNETTQQQNIEHLIQRGLTPMQLNVQDNGKASQTLIFPWALASYNNTTVSIPLMKTKIGTSQQDMVNNSVQELEYAFSNGFSKLIYPKKRKIAVLKGNGEMQNQYIANFVTTLREYYYIAPFTLDSVAEKPIKTLQDLNTYDLIVVAKPTKAFTENEKYVLDQYTMQGGKSLWLIETVAAEKDSLYKDSGKTLAFYNDLNLTDFFFKYGIRINPELVSTLYSAPITLAIGEGSNAQFQPIQWPYSPLANAANKHAIVNNLNLVRFDFANPIDTLKNNVQKTILLESHENSKLEGVPREISLDIVTKTPNPKTFNKGEQTLSVLLEGVFTSVYNNRIKPFEYSKNKDESVPTKLVVVSDGDVIKNDVGRNGPQELGFDKWTGQTYGNKAFLLNAVNYLLDDNGLINIRSKTVKLRFLNSEKIAAQKSKWQLLTIGLPLILLAIFGFTFNYIRRQKYSK